MKSLNFLSCLVIVSILLDAKIILAQTYQPSNRTPVADSTLNTQVSGAGNNFAITGGLNKGQTLFHSFTDFSIPTGGSANFINNPATRDIITRVTGSAFSDLNGTLNSNGANFLLINPNGVVFGPNIQLNVGKAFAATTATGVDLIDSNGGRYTFGTNRNGDAPLLSIDPNVFLNISRLNMGASVPSNPGIVNYGTLQTNNNSQYIGLIGGNVTLTGGKIIAPGGRVDLGGLNTAGMVSFSSNGLVFDGIGLTRGDVLLTDGASISVRATQTLGTVNTISSDLAGLGSSIYISANNLNILNSGAKSNTEFAALDAGLEVNSGVQTAAAGDIKIDVTGRVNLDNSNIKNTLREGAESQVGGIDINANTVSLSNESAISTTITGKGDSGDINIKTTGDVSIAGSTPKATAPITKDSKQSGIFSDTFGQGNAGKITIDTQNRGKLLVTNKGQISSGIYEGAVGDANGVKISAREIDIRNNSVIFSSNLGGKGDAGNIDIKTTGNISISGDTNESTTPTIANSNKSSITSSTGGQGNAGKITIDTQNKGKLSLSNSASISSQISKNAVGNSGDISISVREIDFRNSGLIFSDNLGGTGNAGNIDIKAIGDISISGSTPESTAPLTNNSPVSTISSNTDGQGNAGKITIDTQNRGKLLLSNGASISSVISQAAVGNGNGIEISAQALDLRNGSLIFASNLGGKGDGGNIDIKTTGNISISGSTPESTAPLTNNSPLSTISSDTAGQGNTGKITIDTQNRGKLLLSNGASISSAILENAFGNSNGISISAQAIDLRNRSQITTTNNDGSGNAGNIDIKTTGDISISGSTPESTALITSSSPVSAISSTTSGRGNAGKITIDTQNRGKLSLSNRALISSAIAPTAIGNGGDISISATAVDLRNGSTIFSTNLGGKGDGGKIDIKTIGDISLFNSFISADTGGEGNSGKITIDTQNRGKLLLFDSNIFSGLQATAVGNSKGITISAREVILERGSSIATFSAGKGNAGDIDVKTTGNIDLTESTLISTNVGTGKTGNISINSDRLNLNQSNIIATSKDAIGGNIQITNKDLLLLINSSNIATNSDSTDKNGNAGNITISSPLIIATPGDNNIAANATAGNGGKVDITSQGIFGIQFRPIESTFSNDITASSTFGQSGTVNIDTPGTDPGKDSTELPNATTDASNQISQACSTSTRQNTFIVTGRGGLPANADDPLTADVVWQDARATSSQPAPTSATKIAPPAVGWVFDGKGKVTLIAAGTQGQTAGTTVSCPNVGGN
jgi:filamentous hemagglutinin family protein